MIIDIYYTDLYVDDNEKIVIIRNKPILLIIVDIIAKILKLFVYFILIILLTIGATVLINEQMREYFINIVIQIW